MHALLHHFLFSGDRSSRIPVAIPVTPASIFLVLPHHPRTAETDRLSALHPTRTTPPLRRSVSGSASASPSELCFVEFDGFVDLLKLYR